MSEQFKRLQDDIKATLLATKTTDEAAAQAAKDRLAVLRYFSAKVQEVAKNDKANLNRPVTDGDLVATAQAVVKGIREKYATAKAGAGGTPDILAVTLDEMSPEDRNAMAVYADYMPKQLSDGELTAIIAGILETANDRSPKVKGLINKTLKEKHAGTYVPLRANQIIDSLLAGAGKA